ncbi:MAG: O-antigen ligase family protein [Gemmatimonadota bacterium]
MIQRTNAATARWRSTANAEVKGSQRPRLGGRSPRPGALPGDTWHLDLLRLSIFALILLSLSRVHMYLGLGRLRPALLLAVTAMAYAFLNPRLVNTGRLIRHWPTRVLVSLAVLACLSAAFGLSLGGSAKFILQSYSKVFILAFLLIAAIRGPRDLRFFTWAYVVSCGVLAYFAMFVFGLKVETDTFARLNDLYTFDANDINCILMSGLPLTILCYQSSRMKGKILASLVLVGIGATVARSGSRGGFVGLVVVAALLLFFLPRVSVIKRFGFMFAVAMGLLLFTPPGYWEQMATIGQPKEDYNWSAYYGRKQLAQRGLGYMIRYPVFGLGVNNFARAEGTISERAQNFIDRPGVRIRWRPAHNSFVQVGSEMGVPGLLLWTSLIVVGFFGMRRLRHRLPGRWEKGDPDQRFVYYMTIYLPVSLVGFAVTAFFVSFAYVDVIYILAAFLTGVYVSAENLLYREPRPVGPRPQGPAPRLRASAHARPVRAYR